MDVGHQRGRIEAADRGHFRARLERGCALLHALRHELLDALELHGRDNRPDVDGLVERRTDAQGFEARLQLDESIVDAFLQEQAGAGAADLALVEPDRVDDALDGRVEVGVIEDDERRLAAEPSVSDLPEPAVASRMRRPTSVEPVKAILSMPGWPTITRRWRRRR